MNRVLSLAEIRIELEHHINATPTGPKRNALTDANIYIMMAENEPDAPRPSLKSMIEDVMKDIDT